MTLAGALRRLLMHPRLRAAGSILALALVLSAIIYIIARGGDQWSAAWTALKQGDWRLIGLFIAAVIGNIALSGLFYSVLIMRYGKVGLLEMQALIATSSLINYLPLRPGLFGRVAYHKTINDIAVRDSVRLIITGVVLSIIVGIIGAVAAAGAIATGAHVGVLYCVLAIIALSFALGFPPLGARRWSRALIVHAAAVPMAIRFVDVLIWSGRYAIVFALVGRPIAFETALALAIISTIATMVPFISNGLGLREWAVALAAPMLEVELASQFALSADLIHRAGEVLIAIIVGSAGIAYLASLRSHRQMQGHASAST